MSMTPRGWSISALSVELGMDRRTVAKRLKHIEPFAESGNAKLYRLSDVVDALALANAAEPADFDDARTRKMAADAILAEIEVARARGEVAEIALVAKVVGEEYAAVRAKALSVPEKYAPILETTDGVDAKRDVLRGAMTEMLEELLADRDLRSTAEAGNEDMAGPAEAADGQSEAAADPDGKRMGGRGKASEPGGERGAGAVDNRTQ